MEEGRNLKGFKQSLRQEALQKVKEAQEKSLLLFHPVRHHHCWRNVPLQELTDAVRHYLKERSKKQTKWQSEEEKLISMATRFVSNINHWRVSRDPMTEVQTQLSLAHLQSH